MKAALAVIIVLAFGGLALDAADACSVDVFGRKYYDIEHDGHPRNNPDNTLYPGDAFTYSFEYRFYGNCYAERVHGVRDSGAVRDETENGPARVGNSGSIDGVAEIMVPEALDCLSNGLGGWSLEKGESQSCGGLQMSISAKERVVRTNELGETYIVIINHRDTASITPAIMAPVTAINLTERVIRDIDLYNATNIDWTSYPWDPVAIEHEIDFMWSAERNGTIAFEYERRFAPLVEEGGFTCDGACEVTLRYVDPPTGTGFHAHNRTAENGGGMYVYTAPSKTDAGRSSMRYDVTVLNIDRQLETADASISKLIVLYEPVYDHYAYTVLKDGGKTPYDDGQAVVLRYGGSMGTGPDDTSGLHEDRRSKINAFYPRTVGYSEYPEIDEVVLEPGRLRWGSAGWQPGGPDGAFSSNGPHAVFAKAGYGVVRFTQEIGQDFLEGANRYRGYENVTTNNLLASDFWAGNDSLLLVNYTYQYPHAYMAAWFHITAYGASDYNIPYIDWSAPVGVIIYPDAYTHDRHSDFEEYDDGLIRVWIDDYLWAKTMHDTGDESFADAVANDTYVMAGSGSGTGKIAVWMNKTTLEFVEGVADLYSDGAQSILDIPRYYTFDMPAQFSAWVIVDERFRNVTIPWEYYFDYHEVANTNGGLDVPHARQGGDEVWFRTGTEFGIVDYVLVDGLPAVFYGNDCSDGCTFSSVPGTVDIDIVNIWGGNASFTLRAADAPPEHVGAEDVLLSDDRWFLILTVITTAAAIYFIIRVLKRLQNDTERR